MFSNTVSEGKICATWNEREMPSRVISREGRPVMSRSSNRMVPLLGRRWPVIMLMKVVLPAPLAPMMPTVCCAGTSRVMSRAATIEPKVFSRSRTERIAVMTPVSGAPAQAMEQRAEAFRQEQDGQQQRRAEDDLPGAGHEIDGDRAHQLEHQRADEGGGDRAGAGEDGDEHEAARGRPIRHVGIDMRHRQRRERAAEAGEHPGNHQLEMDQAIDRDAEEFQPDLVVAHRHRERAGDGAEIERDQEGGDRATGRAPARTSARLSARPRGA